MADYLLRRRPHGRDAGYRDQAHAAEVAGDFSGTVEPFSYRVVVGEKGSEIGRVIPVDGTAMDAHDVLQRELETYNGDGWGRIEYTLPTMEGWERLDPQ